MIRISDIKAETDTPIESVVKKAAAALGLKRGDIKRFEIRRRSVDARKKEGKPKFSYALDVEVDNESDILRRKIKNVKKAPDERYETPKAKAGGKRPIIVGFGPAGMFCALILAQAGLKPIVLERGKDVDARKADVKAFWEKGVLNTESNAQFGEGGAGAFSDGKLTARSKDLRCRKVLAEFVKNGAPNEIAYSNKPHIGTDKLTEVIKNIRDEIISLGGQIRFESKLTGINTDNGGVVSACVNGEEIIETDSLVLALGHSARDSFETLYNLGFAMERKPFAVGVRIEHSQSFINKAQYEDESFAEKLGAADYKLTHTAKDGRGVYSFCMCPGGYVVAAASEENRLAVNGMSLYARDGKNANSAILAQLFPEDFGGDHPLQGMYFQRELEEKAFKAGGGNYCAPIQYLSDFLGKKPTDEKVLPTYKPNTKQANMEEIFPSFIIEALREGITAMGKKLKGFDDGGAVLTAAESRSSSPVRILRDCETLQSLSFKGVYPCGEGAGYSGGIVSSAVDGVRVAEKIAEESLKEGER